MQTRKASIVAEQHIRAAYHVESRVKTTTEAWERCCKELIVYNCSVSKSFGVFRNFLGVFRIPVWVFRIFWGVSNLLGCFESFGVFRIFWSVSNLLGCFESFGVFRIFWSVSNLLGCFESFGGVSNLLGGVSD